MSWLRALVLQLSRRIRLKPPDHEVLRNGGNRDLEGSPVSDVGKSLSTCSSCGVPMMSETSGGFSWTHNPQTCWLVNLALREMGVSFDQFIRVNIYEHSGPLKGFYHTAYPYTIHVSDQAYALCPEYTIFHETKHLVDCLTTGWSEEMTPDLFARSLCAKYGFRSPLPHSHYHAYRFPPS